MAEEGEDFEQYYVDQQVIWMPVEDIIPYDRNAKIHDNMLGYLKNTIRKVKFRTPIYVDKDNVIIAGHARRLAALALGMKKVPVIVADDLDEEQVRLWRLADNRLTELSDYDLDALGLEIADLKDLGVRVEDFGLDFDFGDPLDGWEDGETEEDDAGEDQFLKGAELPDEPFTREGDIILMGEHTLVCGDPLDALIMERLMGAHSADIAFVAPPVALEDEDADYEAFLHDAVSMALGASHEAFLDLPLIGSTKDAFVHTLGAWSGNLKDLIYWSKSGVKSSVKGGVISSSVEPIICLGRDGSRRFRHMPNVWYGVIEGPAATNDGYSKFHTATRPLYLLNELISAFTEEHDTVLDMFGGVGTTLIACSDLQRVARIIESEPKLCDLMVMRYVDHTGDDAVTVIRNGERIPFPTESE